MKKLIIILLIFALALSLVGCGGGGKAAPSEAPAPVSEPADAEPENKVELDGDSEPALSWPTASFITPGMKYSGGGEITYTEFIDGSTQESGISMWSVYINGGTIDDAKAYIDALKNDGFAYYSTIGGDEPDAVLEFGYYQWQGEADGGSRYATVYVSDETDTYGGSGAEYTMYIMMMDQNMYK